jgi:uncharacterized membrane protein YkgB
MILSRFYQIEARLIDAMSAHGPTLARISLGIVFLWFGALKFFPGLSPAEAIAGRTIGAITFGHVSPGVSMPILAVFECTIGAAFITGRMLRFALPMLFLHLPGTMLPLVLFPHEAFAGYFVPTLLGQYIVKNIVLFSAAIVVAGTLRAREFNPAAEALVRRRGELVPVRSR